MNPSRLTTLGAIKPNFYFETNARYNIPRMPSLGHSVLIVWQFDLGCHWMVNIVFSVVDGLVCDLSGHLFRKNEWHTLSSLTPTLAKHIEKTHTVTHTQTDWMGLTSSKCHLAPMLTRNASVLAFEGLKLATRGAKGDHIWPLVQNPAIQDDMGVGTPKWLRGERSAAVPFYQKKWMLGGWPSTQKSFVGLCQGGNRIKV